MLLLLGSRIAGGKEGSSNRGREGGISSNRLREGGKDHRIEGDVISCRRSGNGGCLPDEIAAACKMREDPADLDSRAAAVLGERSEIGDRG